MCGACADYKLRLAAANGAIIIESPSINGSARNIVEISRDAEDNSPSAPPEEEVGRVLKREDSLPTYDEAVESDVKITVQSSEMVGDLEPRY